MSALNYTECEIDRSVVASARATFEELHATISGRSGEHNTITQPVGFDFSDLIGEGLRSAAAENHFSWSSSMMACTHAYGVLDKISKDVQWYEQKIEEIEESLSTAIANASEPDNLTIVNQIIESHNMDAREAWRTLESRCDESEELLRDGPTPDNIRALSEGGHLGEHGQIGFYTTNNLDYFYVDETQAETIAIHIENAVINGYEGSIEALEDNPEHLALVANIISRAQNAQQNGDKLLDGEIEFLETLFGDLANVGDNDPSFLNFMDQVNASEHISDSLKEEISRNLANSMLVLSDENIGGGVNSLPEDVREVAFGNNVQPVGSIEGDDPYTTVTQDPEQLWRDSFLSLSDFLSSSDSRVRGGTEFSVALLGSSAMHIEQVENYGPMRDQSLQEIFDVATRNPEASNVMITGEYFDGSNYRHHDNHSDYSPEHFLEVIYSHQWEDDGDAVSGITDWISSFKESGTEEERHYAGNAAHALIDLLTTDEDGENPFRDTASEGDGHYPLAVTEINPEIAASLGSVYLSYLDDFSIDTNDSGYIELDGNREDLYLFHENGDRALLLPQDVKEKFLQLLVANEDLAPNIIAATESQERRIIEAFLTHPDVGNNVGGQAAADLRTTLDNALIQEYVDRDQSIKEAQTSANNQWQTGYNVFTAISTGLGGASSTPMGIGTEVLIKVLEQPLKDYVGDLVEENIQFEYIEDLDQRFMKSDADIRDHANLQLLDVMVGMDLIDMDTLKEEGLLIEEADGTMRLPATAAEWGTGSSGYMSAVEDVISETSFENDDRMDSYVRNFMELYGPDLHEGRLE